MENWKRFLSEQEKDPVIHSINKDKIKDQFRDFIEKQRAQIPEIESIVDRYVEMKMQQGSTDYSDLANYVADEVAKNKTSTEEDPSQQLPTDDPVEFDPTDHRSWRPDQT